MNLQIDRHVAFSLLLRLWSIFAGAFIILVIPHTLSKVQQGYYFTFSSLLATQMFFELGLNTVITQIVGHEMAFLKFNDDHMLEGSPEHLSRIHSLFRLIHKIYLVMAILFFVFAFLGGIIFFKNQPVQNSDEWVFVWPFLVLFTSISLFASPFLSVLEGMGLVAKISKLRLAQSIVGYLVLFSCLFMGFGLKATIGIPAAAAIFSSVWLWYKYKKLFLTKKDYPEAAIISWRSEIFPFQWRIALSWLSGYFIYQLFNPIIFSTFGPEAAGQVGLALTVFATVGALSFSWVNAKVPVMTNLIATNQRQELNQLFRSLVLRSLLLNILCCAGFIISIELFKYFDFPLAQRVPSLQILLLLSVVCVANHFIFSAAAFMRAHKEEPMLVNSIVIAGLSLIGLYIGSKISVQTMMLTYSGIISLIALPWTIMLFRRYYSLNHFQNRAK